MKMTGNTILVTGGTSGIGRSLAEALHDRGNKVIVAGRRQALLDEVTVGRNRMAGMQLDLGDRASLPRFADDVRTRFPGLNVLVANAGISSMEDMANGGTCPPRREWSKRISSAPCAWWERSCRA